VKIEGLVMKRLIRRKPVIKECSEEEIVKLFNTYFQAKARKFDYGNIEMEKLSYGVESWINFSTIDSVAPA
jgi:hypothetical protein